MTPVMLLAFFPIKCTHLNVINRNWIKETSVNYFIADNPHDGELLAPTVFTFVYNNTRASSVSPIKCTQLNAISITRCNQTAVNYLLWISYVMATNCTYLTLNAMIALNTVKRTFQKANHIGDISHHAERFAFIHIEV